MEFTNDAIRNVLEAAPDAMMVVSRDGTILQLNAQAERTFGASRALLLDTSIDALVPSHAEKNHVAHRASFWAPAASCLRADATEPSSPSRSAFRRHGSREKTSSSSPFAT